MNFNSAIDILKANQLTCIIFDSKGNEFHRSTEKGLRPLMRPLLINEESLEEKLIFDKLIGKAAASLIAHSGANFCFGITMSESAISIFKQSNINYLYEKKVDVIKNDSGTDLCPMENMVKDFNSAKEGYDYLYNF